MRDETTKTGQDTSSGATGQSSGSKGGTTSKDKGKLYTDAQIAKIKSDAAAEAGRQRKAAEQERDSLKQELQTTTSRLDTLEREVNESRLAEARGDPDQLRAYQRDQATTRRERELADRERDLNRREEQLKTDRAELDKDRGVVSIAYVAAKHGLETEELESLGISDQDVLERVAEKLAARKSAESGNGEDGKGEETPSGEATELMADSGEGVGGEAGALTSENIESMSMGSLEKAIEKASQ